MGGWANTITQQTKLTPYLVKETLEVVKWFIHDFNIFIAKGGMNPVRIGCTLGSTAYYKLDDAHTEYGDIDLQMVAPDNGKTAFHNASCYNNLIDEFINTHGPTYIYDPSEKANGHLIFNVDGKQVQVDMLWTTERLSHWQSWRMTPQHGVKGLIMGNLFSTLGEVTNMSLQSAVLIKIKNGEPINYQRGRKEDKVIEISHDIENFGLDILEHVYEAVTGTVKGMKVHPTLVLYPGIVTGDVQINDIAQTVIGLAKSYELNDLYGKYNLKEYKNADELLEAYMQHFLAKAHKAATGSKLTKVTQTEELARVKDLTTKIHDGTVLVQLAFAI